MPSKRKKESKLAFLNSTKVRALLVVLIVGLMGVGYFLYQTFAATDQVKYWGSLTKAEPVAKYKLTTGKGQMKLVFSNNTADVTLTVRDSANAVVNTIKSAGKKDVTKSFYVKADTYTLTLTTTKPFKSNKGFKVIVDYPTEDLTKPTAVITKPLASETVSGIVDVAAQSEDPKGVTKVEFYSDSKLIGMDDTSPYEVKWDTTSLDEGSHTISVKSTSTIGMYGEASATVKVVKPAEPTVAPNEKFGMSAPKSLWDQRLAEVGGKTHINYRRIFLTGFDANLNLVQRAISDGMVPIISFKVSPYSWSQVASGAADADIKALVKRLDAIPGEKFVALHHEPAKDGTAKDWSGMQEHALPILKTGQDVKVGVIANGWWWSNKANGYSDAEIAEWITPKVIEISDVIAADTYQDANLRESGGPKIENMSAWAQRVGGVKALGIGEFNGVNVAGITEAMNAIKADPLIEWACMWNSVVEGESSGMGQPLSGERLEAFKLGLSTPNQT
jgi:hypothetical protein